MNFGRWNSFSATTAWSYTTNRGFLDRKTYNDAKYASYEYSKAGRLTKRTWARGVVTDYAYNPAGDIATVVYSDGSAGMTNTYDRRARLTYELYTPTIALVVPMNFERWDSFSVEHFSNRSKAHLRQTEHPNALPASWRCPGQPGA